MGGATTSYFLKTQRRARVHLHFGIPASDSDQQLHEWVTGFLLLTSFTIRLTVAGIPVPQHRKLRLESITLNARLKLGKVSPMGVSSTILFQRTGLMRGFPLVF